MSKSDLDLFWLAPGVVDIDGKEYGAEMPLPVDKIAKKQLKKWLTSKPPKVGSLMASAVDGKDNTIADLKEQIVKLKGNLADAAKGIGKLEDLESKLNDATSQIEYLEAAAEASDQEKADLANDNQEKAALIEKLNAEAKTAAEAKAAHVEKHNKAKKDGKK